MEPPRCPLLKIFDTPFISLDETSIEIASILFLLLAVTIAAESRRRRQLVRRIVQSISFLFFFFVVYSCLGVFGMIRNGLYGLSLIGTVYTESFYWLALPVGVICVTVVAGPVFCGWICPTGTIQEWAGILRKRLIGSPEGRVRNHVLLAVILVGFVTLVIWVSSAKRMFVEDSSLHWAASLILLCYLVVIGAARDLSLRRIRWVSIVAIIFTALSHLAITSPVHFAFTSRDDAASALTTLVIVAASMVVSRSWCRYLCPWGYLMGLLSRFSFRRLQVVADRCNHCGTCSKVCDVAAIVPGAPSGPDGPTGPVVLHEHCQLCYACVDACPNSAFVVVEKSQEDDRGQPRSATVDPDHRRA